MNTLIWFYIGFLAFGLFCHFVLYKIFWLKTRYTKTPVDNLFVKHCYRPLLWLIIIIAARFILPIVQPDYEMVIERNVFGLAIIFFMGWLVVKSVYVLEEYLLYRFDINQKDNLKARKIITQFRVLKRIIIIVVSIIALGMILMSFEKVRQLGTAILASAGIIGIVVGMAAQKTIGTFIAGIQLAFTQPIRLDDVVIVENEWGRIEEITLTYVVVRIWDQRRLIVPITYFIEQPFQNWTRQSADILGTVFIYVDYTIPIDEVREQLQKILKASEHWDGKVCGLQVTNTSERAIELRALMSSADASLAWTLRCEVREKLIKFIQEKYPQSLPKIRAEMKPISSENSIF